MLVGYSSSSEEEIDAVTEDIKTPAEEDADDHCSERKKPKLGDKVTKARLYNLFCCNCLIDWGPGQRKPIIAKYKTSLNERNWLKAELHHVYLFTPIMYFSFLHYKREDSTKFLPVLAILLYGAILS